MPVCKPERKSGRRNCFCYSIHFILLTFDLRVSMNTGVFLYFSFAFAVVICENDAGSAAGVGLLPLAGGAGDNSFLVSAGFFSSGFGVDAFSCLAAVGLGLGSLAAGDGDFRFSAIFVDASDASEGGSRISGGFCLLAKHTNTIDR